MITYNDIYEALREERSNDKLQPINKDFIKDVSDYLEEKKEMADKKDDVFSEATTKIKKQFENAVTLFKELMTRRKKKILNLAFISIETGVSKKDFENMLPFEKELFDKVVKGMKEQDKKVNDLMSKDRKDGKHVMVKFKEDIQKFLDEEGEEIGPFEEGEIANLPKSIVNILSDDNKVEVVED